MTFFEVMLSPQKVVVVPASVLVFTVTLKTALTSSSLVFDSFPFKSCSVSLILSTEEIRHKIGKNIS